MKKIKIVTVEDLTPAMERLAQSTSEVERINAEYKQQLDDVTKEREDALAPFMEEKVQVEAAILAFVEANKSALFPEIKTFKTPFGNIALKITNPKLVYDSEEDVIKKIRGNFFRYIFDKNYRAAIKVKRSLVAAVLNQMDEKVLASLGVTKKQEELTYLYPIISTEAKKEKGKKTKAVAQAV